MTIRCIDATRKILIFVKGTFILALSTFSHNVRLCITTNVCILDQSHVSGLDKGLPEGTRQTFKTLGIVGVTVERCVRSFQRTGASARACTHTDSRINTVRILN